MLTCIILELIWRGGRAAEGARLESVYTVKRIEGSNPSLSASLHRSNFFGVIFQIHKPTSDLQVR